MSMLQPSCMVMQHGCKVLIALSAILLERMHLQVIQSSGSVLDDQQESENAHAVVSQKREHEDPSRKRVQVGCHVLLS